MKAKITKRSLISGAAALISYRALAGTLTPQVGGAVNNGFDGGPGYLSGAPGSTFNFLNNTAVVNGAPQANAVATLAITQAASAYSERADTLYSANSVRRDSLGLVLDATRTNALVQSQAFNNASWLATALTVTDNAVAAPDGTATGCTLALTANANVLKSVAGTVPLSVGQFWVISIYAKAGTDSWMLFQVNDVGSSIGGAWFNLATGAVGSTRVVGGLMHVDLVTMYPAANGYYRCVVAVHVTGSGVSAHAEVLGVTGDTATIGTSGQNFSIWGAQAEIVGGATTSFADSYIPTTASPVARVADVMSLGVASNAASATVTFDDNSTQVFFVDTINNKLRPSAGITPRGLIKSISIPAPLTTTYVGAVSSTATFVDPIGANLGMECKYTCAPFRDSVPWFKILMPSWYITYNAQTMFETVLAGGYTVKASVEYPGGTFTPIAFGGVTSGSAVTPGTDLLSDQINVAIPLGAQPVLWFFVTGGGANGYPMMQFADSLATILTNQSASPVDRTASGGTVTNNVSGSNAFGPMAIVGPTAKVTLTVFGDSRIRANGGEILQQLNAAGVAMILCSNNADRATWFRNRSTGNHRAGLRTYSSHVLLEYGINDMGASGNSETVCRGDINFIMNTQLPGACIILTTLEASTASTDAWATEVNQTPTIAANGVEIHNTWRRTVPSPAAFVWDIASATSTLNGSSQQVWRAGAQTADGLHANATGVATIVASGIVNSTNMRR